MLSENQWRNAYFSGGAEKVKHINQEKRDLPSHTRALERLLKYPHVSIGHPWERAFCGILISVSALRDSGNGLYLNPTKSSQTPNKYKSSPQTFIPLLSSQAKNVLWDGRWKVDHLLFLWVIAWWIYVNERPVLFPGDAYKPDCGWFLVQ